MASKIQETNQKDLRKVARKVKQSTTMPPQQISKIIKNYTRRFSSKLIHPQTKKSENTNFSSLEDLSEINRTQSPSEELLLLNSVRSSPPKAEISVSPPKFSLQDEAVLLKKQLASEKNKFSYLQQAYKELYEKMCNEENCYREKIKELTINKTGKNDLVNRFEFNELLKRVNYLEVGFRISKTETN